MPDRPPTLPPSDDFPKPILFGLKILSAIGMAYAFLSAVSHPLFTLGQVSWFEVTVLLFGAVLYVLNIMSHIIPHMRKGPRRNQILLLGICLCMLLILGTKPFIVNRMSLTVPKIIKEGLLLGISSDLFSEVKQYENEK